ncbi:hypothetical protein ACFL2H_05015, partial [Planctomycetota bacterium]
MAEPFLFVVRDPYVHELLDLTEKQSKSLRSLNDKADPQIWRIRNRPPQEAARTSAKLIAVTRREIKKILDEQQIERLQQIEMRTQGVRSLLREDVVATLRMSKSQVGEILQVITLSDAQKTELKQRLQNGGESTKLNKQYHEVQVREQEQILKVLKPAQQQQWVGMLGPRVDLKKIGRVRFKAPDFSKSSKWVNSPPLTLDKLKGKVVALHFYAFA